MRALRLMLLIPCPWCGAARRDRVPLRRPGAIAYPADPDALDDAAWAEYLFMRDNPKGAFAERWVHAAGCRRWFNVDCATPLTQPASLDLPERPDPTR